MGIKHLSLIVAVLTISSGVDAGTQDSAVIAFHLQPVPRGDACTVSPLFGNRPCSDFLVTGTVSRSVLAYLMVARADTAEGIMGVSFSLSFPRDLVEPVWVLCADMDFPGPSWPDSGGSILVTWDPTNCQRSVIGQDGGHAVAGFFSIFIFDVGTLELDQTPNPNFFVTDCSGNKTEIQTPGGIIGFGTSGFNPCQPTPIAPTTWGRIKAMYGN